MKDTQKEAINGKFRQLDIQLSETRHILSSLKKDIQKTDLKTFETEYLKELVQRMEYSLKETHDLKERLHNELVYKEII